MVQVRARPERPALVFLNADLTVSDSVSYGKLLEQARSVASWIQRHNLGGKTILLLFRPGLNFARALLGCFLGGAIAVPVAVPGRRESMTRMQACRDDCDARVGLLETGIAVPPLDGFCWVDICEALTTASTALPGVRPEVAFLQYTSGSTRRPTAVVISQSNLAANLELLSRDSMSVAGDSEEVVYVSWLPHYHDMGLTGVLLYTLSHGGLLVQQRPLDFLQRPLRWLQAISAWRATHSAAPNFAFELCVQRVAAADLQGLNLSSLGYLANAAEPVSHSVVEDFARLLAGCGLCREALMPGYGLAEATAKVAQRTRCDGPFFREFCSKNLGRGRAVARDGGGKWLASYGSPHRDLIDVEIVDGQGADRLGPGQVGEIVIGGACVGGRLGSDRNDEGFLHLGGQRWVRTGDLGFWFEKELYVCGRCKDVLIESGANYYAQDVEEVARTTVACLRSGRSAAFTAQDGRHILVQELKGTSKAEVAEVERALRAAVLAELGLKLHEVVLVRPGQVPRTTSGKVQRLLCRQFWESGDLRLSLEEPA